MNVILALSRQPVVGDFVSRPDLCRWRGALCPLKGNLVASVRDQRGFVTSCPRRTAFRSCTSTGQLMSTGSEGDMVTTFSANVTMCSLQV
jgi:hypothetical protein